jgi:hypothetical protein
MMYQKQKGLTMAGEILQKPISFKKSKLLNQGWKFKQNAGAENEGMFHYVIENTYRQNVRFLAFQDIIENKQVGNGFPRC